MSSPQVSLPPSATTSRPSAAPSTNTPSSSSAPSSISASSTSSSTSAPSQTGQPHPIPYNFFPLAYSPDLLRAVQKDEILLADWKEQLTEHVQPLLQTSVHWIIQKKNQYLSARFERQTDSFFNEQPSQHSQHSDATILESESISHASDISENEAAGMGEEQEDDDEAKHQQHEEDEAEGERLLDALPSESDSAFAPTFASSYIDLRPEIDLLARASYYGLTSFSGKQTLGEEYCDLVPVERTETSLLPTTGIVDRRTHPHHNSNDNLSTFHPASPSYPWGIYGSHTFVNSSTRTKLFMFQTFLPYCVDRLKKSARRWEAPSDSSFDGWGHSVESSEVKEDIDPQVSDQYMNFVDEQGHQLNEIPPSQQIRPAKENILIVYLRTVYNRALQYLQDGTFDFHYAILSRTHLMIFYFTGMFLELNKRLAGVQYIQIRTLQVNRPSYHFFGILIFIQLAIKLFQEIRQTYREYQERRRNALLEDKSSPAFGSHSQMILPGIPAAEYVPDENNPDGDEEEAPNCTLCLCPRTHTTATECGHLFCWVCIAECLNNKPECPMCRQPCSLNSLIRLAHYK